MRKWAAASVIVAILATVWSGAWFVIAQQTERAIDRWIQDEKTRDREWSCGHRSMRGFPFDLQVVCEKPTFNSKFGPIQTSSAERLNALANIFGPRDITFTIDGPLKLTGPDGSAALRWNRLDGSLKVRTDAPDLSLRIQGLSIVESSGNIADWIGSSVTNLAVRMQRSPDRAPGADAQTLTIDISGLKAAPVDAMFDNKEPLQANMTAIILNAGSATVGTLAQRVDRWSASGGRLQVGSLSIAKGESLLNASGDLSLDERRRPSGPISLRVSGIQPVIARLKLPAAPLAIEGLLRGTAGRNRGSSLVENRTLPLELRAGRLYVGPIRTPVVIPPLF